MCENHRKKSHSTLRAKRAITFWVNKSLKKCQKMVNFVIFFENLKFAVEQSYQVNFNRTKIGGKCQNCQNSNATFWVIFKHCEIHRKQILWKQILNCNEKLGIFWALCNFAFPWCKLNDEWGESRPPLHLLLHDLCWPLVSFWNVDHKLAVKLVKFVTVKKEWENDDVTHKKTWP